MDAKTLSRPELPQLHPEEATPFPLSSEAHTFFHSSRFNKVLVRDVRDLVPPPEAPIQELDTQTPDAQRPNVRSLGDIGRLAMVNLQSLTTPKRSEAAPSRRRRWLGRAATVLFGSGAAYALWALAPRTAQAAGIGIHFGAEHMPDPVENILPFHTDSTAAPASSGHHEAMMLASSQRSDGIPDNGVHHYGGVRIEGADYADNSRTAESWPTDKDCAWNWAEQDLAKAAHEAGLPDNQIHTVAHNENAIAEVTRTYVNSNGSIKHAPHHWLYDGHTYDTEAARAKAKAIVHDLYPNNHVETKPAHPAPAPTPIEVSHDTDNDGIPDSKDPDPFTPNNDPDVQGASKDTTKDEVSWIEARWNDVVRPWKEMNWEHPFAEFSWLRNYNWLKATTLGVALFAMRQYENGRQAAETAYQGSTLMRTKRNPRTWWHDWSWRAQPIVVTERTVPFSRRSPRTWFARREWTARQRQVVEEEPVVVSASHRPPII